MCSKPHIETGSFKNNQLCSKENNEILVLRINLRKLLFSDFQMSSDVIVILFFDFISLTKTNSTSNSRYTLQPIQNVAFEITDFSSQLHCLFKKVPPSFIVTCPSVIDEGLMNPLS